MAQAMMGGAIAILYGLSMQLARRKLWVELGGSLYLQRRKLAWEPQIHGGKKTRVVFYDASDGEGGAIESLHANRLAR